MIDISIMKKLSLIATLFILILSCTDKRTDNTMVLNGEIKGLKKGVVYLQHVPDSLLVTIDSVKVDKEGKFTFSVPLTEPELFYLYLEKADGNELNDRVSFFGEPGEMNFSSTWNAFEQDYTFQGSELHNLLEEYKKVVTRFNKRDLELLQASFADSIKTDSLAMDSLQKLSDNNLMRRYLYTLNFALNNKQTHLAPFLAVSETPDANLMYLDSIYKVLPDSIASGKYGNALKKLIEERKESE